MTTELVKHRFKLPIHCAHIDGNGSYRHASVHHIHTLVFEITGRVYCKICEYKYKQSRKQEEAALNAISGNGKVDTTTCLKIAEVWSKLLHTQFTSSRAISYTEYRYWTTIGHYVCNLLVKETSTEYKKAEATGGLLCKHDRIFRDLIILCQQTRAYIDTSVLPVTRSPVEASAWQCCYSKCRSKA